MANLLAEEHAEIVVTDPKALRNAAKDLTGLDRGTLEPDPYKAAEGCDAIVIMTEWACYRDLDWARLYASMRKPALLFDTRNILDGQAMKTLGFNVLAVGKTL